MGEAAAEGPVRSALHDRHVALDAKFAEFGGWSMPLEYPTGVVSEHTAVRDAAGMFDVSHLGTAWVRGPGAAEFVNTCLSNDLSKISPGHAQYTLCCDESGGVVDDLIAYLMTPDEVLLVPNAANSAEVLRRLAEAAPSGIEVIDEHRDRSVLAVQGPASDAVLSGAGLPTGHEYMRFARATFGGEDVIVCRTGYTGERGYELVVPSTRALDLWDVLVESGAQHGLTPCGLGARDTLRTEMGYPLHGNELSLEITPNQARSAWAVGWDKPDFWGRDALLAERESGAPRRLVGLLAEQRAIPRPGMAVTDGEGAEVGLITSGTFSPTLKQGIGLALLSPEVAVGDVVSVDVRGRSLPFRRVALPFVESSVR